MLAKKNNHAETKPHYSLRKLSVGVASVLISTSVYAGMAGHVQAATADKNPNQITEVKSTENKEDSSVKKDTADKDSSVQLQDVKATSTELSKAAGEQKEAAKTAENGKAEAEKPAAVEKPAEKPATEAKKSEPEKKDEDSKAAAKALGTSLKVKATDATTDDKVDPLRNNRGDLITSDNTKLIEPTTDPNHVVDATGAKEVEGEPATSTKVATPGSTQLGFKFTLTEEQRKNLQPGDYFEIKMGLPYKVTANGQEELLSYGQVVNQTTPIAVYDMHGTLVGHVVPVNADDKYASSIVDHDSKPTDPKISAGIKNSDLGGTNGYYRLVFNDNASKGTGGMDVVVGRLNWYNGVPNEDQQKAPLQSKTFKLYSPDSSVNEISPTDDIQIGNFTTASGLKIKVDHESNVKLNNQLGAVSPTRTAAHWWYQTQDGTWRLGYNSQLDPSQMEGNSLAGDSKTLGNDFTMSATIPADHLTYGNNGEKTVDYYFADEDQVTKDIERMIVGETTTLPTDNVSGHDGVYLHRDDLVTKPKVHVKRTITNNPDGTATAHYHVTIKGDYQGFAKEVQSDGDDLQSAVTLISWRPSDPRDLLPPADTHIDHPYQDGAADQNYDAKNYIQTHYYGRGFIGSTYINGVAISKDLFQVLQAHPWRIVLTSTQEPDNPNLLYNPNDKDHTTGENGEAGYNFVKYPIAGANVPSNFGFAAGDYGEIIHDSVAQIIHYYEASLDGEGHLVILTDKVKIHDDDDPSTRDDRQVTFVSTDDGNSWMNAGTGEPTGVFYGFAAPEIPGYDIYGYDINDGKYHKLNETEKRNIGWQKPFTQDCYIVRNHTTTRIPGYTENATWRDKDGKLVTGKAQVLNYYYVKQKQIIKYNVMYQNESGQDPHLYKDYTVLGTGLSGHVLSDDTKHDWQSLLTYYANGVTIGHEKYVLVPSNDSRNLQKTSDLPQTYDYDASVDQLVTIWLVEKKTTTPDNPPKTETQKIRYKVGYQDANGNVQFMSPAENQIGILLGQGPSHSALKSIFENDWEYLQNNVDRTYNGKNYVLVKHGDKGANGQLHDTDDLPEFFDNNTKVDQVVMIWLVEKPTTPYIPPETPDNPNPDQPDNPNPDQPDTPNPDQPNTPTPDQPHNPERPDIPASPTISKRTHTSQTPVVHKTNVPKQKATLPQTGSSYLALAMGALLSLLGLAGLRKKKN